MPADPPTPTPDTDGRDYLAEQKEGIKHLEEQGYVISWVHEEHKQEYAFCFFNATGTYKGTAYHNNSAGIWIVSYYPVNDEDPNATFGYTKGSGSLIKVLDGIDPAWIYYEG